MFSLPFLGRRRPREQPDDGGGEHPSIPACDDRVGWIALLGVRRDAMACSHAQHYSAEATRDRAEVSTTTD